MARYTLHEGTITQVTHISTQISNPTDEVCDALHIGKPLITEACPDDGGEYESYYEETDTAIVCGYRPVAAPEMPEDTEIEEDAE